MRWHIPLWCSRLSISLFVSLYVFVIGWWLCYPCPLRSAVLAPFRSTINYWGLWQGWGVFAPQPRRCIVDLEARIYYKDGTSEYWQYPRIEDMGLLDKFYKERYRKFGYDQLNWEAYSYLWPDFARYLSHKFGTGGKTVIGVDLTRHWRNLLTPDKELHGQHEPFHTYTFFRGRRNII